MLLEIGRLAAARYDTATAVAAYREAGNLVPQDHRSWLFLGQLLQHQQADSLLGRAAALCADSVAQQAAWNALPHDYVLMGGCEEAAAPEPAAPEFPATAPAALGPDEIHYLLPTRGWEEKNEGTGSLVHVEIPGIRYQTITVVPIDVPAELRELPSERQLSQYFAMERRRPREEPWSGFVEGTRAIVGRNFSTLSAQIHLKSASKRAWETRCRLSTRVTSRRGNVSTSSRDGLPSREGRGLSRRSPI
jgi:hypothetical protein